jgi:DNA-binding cell septation regulator SpoVG
MEEQHMSHTDPIISNFRMVKDHPYLRALADINLSGFVVRGIKLEEGAGQLHLGFPGRKVQGAWQLVCESESEVARQRLLSRMSEQYAGLREAA